MSNELTPVDIFQGDAPMMKLVSELDDLFPRVVATPKQSIEDIMYHSGQRSVVEYLIEKLAN